MQDTNNEDSDVLKKISESYPIEYYTNEKNIANQLRVAEVINYFETGPGARVFTPLGFFNLWEKQYQFICDNVNDTDKLLTHVQALPISDLQKHVLFGLIIKLFNGYPFPKASGYGNSQSLYNFTSKLLEIFLDYKDQTPEKEFCKRNYENRHFKSKLLKTNIALNTSFKTRVDAVHIYNHLAKHDTDTDQILFGNFWDLFQDAVERRKIKPKENNVEVVLDVSDYEYGFKVWLSDKGYCEDCSVDRFNNFLKRDVFDTYLENKKKAVDPYSITHSSNNTITFRNKTVHFPFPCYSLFDTITKLRDKLSDVDICAPDLQHYPDKIFIQTALNSHPELAKWIYNIIETWVFKIKEIVHLNKNKELFDSFLGLCRTVATTAINSHQPIVNGQSIAIDQADNSLRLSCPQIALIHCYLRKQITRINADQIAESYGFKKLNSGEGLFQDYIKYSSRTNRTGFPGTERKLKNKIILLESIFEHLTDNAKETLTDEIKTLKASSENQYL